MYLVPESANTYFQSKGYVYGGQPIFEEDRYDMDILLGARERYEAIGDNLIAY